MLRDIFMGFGYFLMIVTCFFGLGFLFSNIKNFTVIIIDIALYACLLCNLVVSFIYFIMGKYCKISWNNL